jgi:hypothetical protein
MSRIILLKSQFDEFTGYSEVTIDTDLGRFTGTSVTRDEDKPYASSFCGCKYAEIKALRKYLKASVKKLKTELKVLTNIRDAFDSSDKCSKDSREWKILMKAIYQKQDEIQAEKDHVESITQHLLKSIAERDKILNRFYAKEGKVD